MTQSIQATTLAANTAAGSQETGSKWYELMAEAWGKALDAKATEMEATAALINGGDDRPATITQLTAQSQQMGFLAQSAHTAISSVGTALETMARKQ
ncbi:hypothetical protein CKO44_12860 [Rubrivivax gelatinosus]|uniref:Uncharacterized protein n=1 Tax=Rubrivivax gelatinosus TaxID=28068 RepID=A0ABS1DXG7_RUBGE|nr:hypothetical protein [Rubrivivax gelatinosus]MBK1614358.1 hypothetical protein [Rubrivivax gelatinosus]MBK1714198.1 hypothetical protein [Rubrivivax gelatinosus]